LIKRFFNWLLDKTGNYNTGNQRCLVYGICKEIDSKANYYTATRKKGQWVTDDGYKVEVISWSGCIN